MIWSIGGLKARPKVVRVEVEAKLRGQESLKDLGEDGQIGDGTM